MSLKRHLIALINWIGIKKIFGTNFFEITVNEYCNRYFATYSPQKLIIIPSLYKKEILPNTVNSDVSWKFINLSGREVPEAYILRLQNGKVYGKKGAIITQEGALLRDLSREFGRRNKHSLSEKIFLKRPVCYSANVAVLSTDGGETYYHWMFDILPRLYLLHTSNDYNKVDYFVVPQLKHKFQKETLKLLGIDNSKLLETLNDNFYIMASNLLVPSLPSLLGTVNKWSCDFLRDTFLKFGVTVSSGNERIYISRKNATTRRLLNEDELIETLKKYDFKIILAEDYPFIEQIGIYSNAKVIVAAHGSGLTNTVFCNQNTTVIDLFSSDFIVPCYWFVANNCSLKYYYTYNEEQDNLHYLPYWEGKNYDYYFPVEKLNQILKLAGIN